MAAARELGGLDGAQGLLAVAAEAKHHADVHRPSLAGERVGGEKQVVVRGRRGGEWAGRRG